MCKVKVLVLGAGAGVEVSLFELCHLLLRVSIEYGRGEDYRFQTGDCTIRRSFSQRESNKALLATLCRLP